MTNRERAGAGWGGGGRKHFTQHALGLTQNHVTLGSAGWWVQWFRLGLIETPNSGNTKGGGFSGAVHTATPPPQIHDVTALWGLHRV